MSKHTNKVILRKKQRHPKYKGRIFGYGGIASGATGRSDGSSNPDENYGWFDARKANTDDLISDISSGRFFTKDYWEGKQSVYHPPVPPLSEAAKYKAEKIAFEYKFMDAQKTDEKHLPNANELENGIKIQRVINSNLVKSKLKEIQLAESERYETILIDYCKQKYGYWTQKSKYASITQEIGSWFGKKQEEDGTFLLDLLTLSAFVIAPEVMAFTMLAQCTIQPVLTPYVDNLIVDRIDSVDRFTALLIDNEIDLPSILGVPVADALARLRPKDMNASNNNNVTNNGSLTSIDLNNATDLDNLYIYTMTSAARAERDEAIKAGDDNGVFKNPFDKSKYSVAGISKMPINVTGNMYKLYSAPQQALYEKIKGIPSSYQ